MKVSEQQKTEWTENPVTLALKELYELEYWRTINCPVTESFIRGEPQLTQENLVEKACKEHEIYTMTQALEGNWSDLEIEDEE